MISLRKMCQLILTISLPITSYVDFRIAITGMHGFLRMTVSGIIVFIVEVIVLGLYQFLVHFLIQGSFQNDRHRFAII